MLLTSFQYFRNRLYEVFKILHVVFAISFIVLLFWHITGEYFTVSLDSECYLLS